MMTDAPCARPGCGAPMAWHTNKSNIEALGEWRRASGHARVSATRIEGWCVGDNCGCAGYLAPEPPRPERTAYVLELTERQRANLEALWPLPPITDYLASHKMELMRAVVDAGITVGTGEPRMCVCGGDADDHNPVTGRCEHVAKWMTVAAARGEPRRDDWIETHYCSCRRFISEEAQP